MDIRGGGAGRTARRRARRLLEKKASIAWLARARPYILFRDFLDSSRDVLGVLLNRRSRVVDIIRTTCHMIGKTSRIMLILRRIATLILGWSVGGSFGSLCRALGLLKCSL